MICKNKRMILLLLLMSLVVISGWGDAQEYGALEAPIKVLIAMEPTLFKNRLVEEVVSRLDDGTIHIVVIKHTNNGLHTVAPDDYSAVLITNSGVGSRVRPWVRKWLDDHRDNDDNILLHTTQREWQWSPDVRVDAVSSASDNKQVNQIADDLVERLQALITG